MKLSELSLRLVGGVFDRDVEYEDILVGWQAEAAPGSPDPNCLFNQTEEAVAWTARCDPGAGSHFCLYVRAQSAGGASLTRSGCVIMDASAPEWPVAPLLSYGGDDDLVIVWPAPYEPHSGPCVVEWSFCTSLGVCTEYASASANQSSSTLLLSSAILANYSGRVWAVARATNRAGLTSEPVRSNRLIVGPREAVPQEGYLRLGPAVVLASLAQAIVRVSGFEEVEYGVTLFTWCVGTSSSPGDLLACRNETSLPHELAVGQLALDGIEVGDNGTFPAVVTATACTLVGGCTRAVSNQIMIDSADPTAGFVTDGLLFEDDSLSWTDVSMLACDDFTCSATPLLDGSESASGRALKLTAAGLYIVDRISDAMRILPSGTQLAATWGGLSDREGALQRVEVCFGTSPGAHDVLPCTQVPASSGLAITAQMSLQDRTVYFATVRAFDLAGRNVTISSAGSRHFGLGPIPSEVYGPTQSFVADCTRWTTRWQPFADPFCAGVVHSWSLCDAKGQCTPPFDTGLGCNSTSCADVLTGDSAADDSIPIVLNTSVSLERGVVYTAQVSATGCSSVTSHAVSSAAVVCDDTPPELNAPTPSIVDATFGYPVVVVPGSAVVTWAGVFSDPESGLDRFEVCLSGEPVRCSAWLPAQLAVSIVVALPRELNSSLSIVAVVRAWNRAGLSAEALTEGATVLSAAPQLNRIFVDGFGDDIGDGAAPCVLNRTESIPVRWDLDEADTLSSLELLVRRGGEEVPLLRSQGLSGNSTVLPSLSADCLEAHQATPQAAGGCSDLVFNLTATDLTGQSVSLAVHCLVQRLPPAVSKAWLEGVALLSDDLYAADPDQAADHQLCWALDDHTATAGGFNVSLSSRGVPVGVDVVTSGEERCVNVSLALEPNEELTFSVFATGDFDMHGPAANVALIADESAPVPGGSLLQAYTGASSDTHQRNSCCVQLHWSHWLEQESAVIGYSLCFNGSAACVDVGNVSRAVVARDTTCTCAVGLAFVGAEPFLYDFPLHVEGGSATPEIQVVLHAHNLVGLIAAVTLVTRVLIEPAAPLFEDVTFERPSLQLGVINQTINQCGGIASGVYHPAGLTLSLEWREMTGLAYFNLCVTPAAGLLGEAQCQRVVADATTATTSALPHGVHNLTLEAVSLGGYRTSLSWLVHADETPPGPGLVYVGSGAEEPSYWGVGDELTCTWEPAQDAQSGVASYHVELVDVANRAASCAYDVQSSVIGSQEVAACSLTATLTHNTCHSIRTSYLLPLLLLTTRYLLRALCFSLLTIYYSLLMIHI